MNWIGGREVDEAGGGFSGIQATLALTMWESPQHRGKGVAETVDVRDRAVRAGHGGAGVPAARSRGRIACVRNPVAPAKLLGQIHNTGVQSPTHRGTMSPRLPIYTDDCHLGNTSLSRVTQTYAPLSMGYERDPSWASGGDHPRVRIPAWTRHLPDKYSANR